MMRPPSMPMIVPITSICLVVVAGEGWLLHRARLHASGERTALWQKKQERDSLVHQSPALSTENESAIMADLVAARRKLAEWRSVLQGADPGRPNTPLPTRPIDAFFELTELIGQLRSSAGQALVEIRPDEHFGFAMYANEGPAPDQIAAVHRQSGAIKCLMEVLLASHPQALLAVRRERPVAKVVQDRQSRADDFFEIDHALSVRQTGLIESDAFQLEFTGPTGALRAFLSGLAFSHLPFVVRGVEVEPLREKNFAQTTAQVPASGASRSLVKPGISKFGVTLELARLAPSPTAVR